MSRTRLLLLAALGLGVVAFAIERWIVTDAEAIERLMDDAADAVARGDDAALTDVVAEDYAERGMDRAALVAWARDLWKRSRATSVAIDVVETRVEGDRAAARVVVRPGVPWAGARFAGRVDLVRTAHGWRVSGVAPDDARLLGR